jgi:hypothetical protein
MTYRYRAASVPEFLQVYLGVCVMNIVLMTIIMIVGSSLPQFFDWILAPGSILAAIIIPGGPLGYFPLPGYFVLSILINAILWALPLTLIVNLARKAWKGPSKAVR